MTGITDLNAEEDFAVKANIERVIQHPEYRYNN
jgi:hypothetical protein